MASGNNEIGTDLNNRQSNGVYVPSTTAGHYGNGEGVMNAMGATAVLDTQGEYSSTTAVELASGGVLITKGQKTMANSLPVCFASDQTVTLTAQIAGTATTAITAGKATDTVVKAAAGFLCSVLVTTSGTNAMEFYDNATAGSGTIIGIIPANTPAGEIVAINFPGANGVTAKGNANNPAVTVAYA